MALCKMYHIIYLNQKAGLIRSMGAQKVDTRQGEWALALKLILANVFEDDLPVPFLTVVDLRTME